MKIIGLKVSKTQIIKNYRMTILNGVAVAMTTKKNWFSLRTGPAEVKVMKH
jgi:hypothetical protein